MDLEHYIWNKNSYAFFLDYLFSLEDLKYKNFHLKIANTNYNIIGIRVPILKKIAKEIEKGNIEDYLKIKIKNNYEEVLIRGLVISSIKDKGEYLKYITDYIPYINCWSICDTVIASSKVIGKNLDFFYNVVINLLKENDEFKNRIAFVILLDYYIEDEYIDEVIELIKNYKSEYYYSNMALSWLISVMYVKYETKTTKLLKKNNLSKEVINKTISKIHDSYRVDKEKKEKLRDLRR